MDLGFLVGRRKLYSKKDIINYIKKSSEYDSNIEKFDQAHLLIFQTSIQQTWLVASNRKLYCILDDSREKDPLISWSIPKDELINIEIETSPHKMFTGLVHIGPKHKGWLYSKELFENTDIVTEIKKLIRNM